jgi:MFS family permease
MILGPVLGGGLASFGTQVPFQAVAALAAGNFALAWWLLPESRSPSLPRAPWRDLARTLVPTPVRLVLAVHDRRIAAFLVVFFLVFTAFAVLESMVTLYLGRRFGASELDAALIFAWIGAVLVLTQGVLLRRLVATFGEWRLVLSGVVLMAAGIAGVAFAPSLAWLYAVGPVIAVGNGLAFPSFTSLYSKACRAEEAGELLGESQSMATAGRIVGPLAAGALMREVGLEAPFLASGALLLGVAIGLGALRSRLLDRPGPPGS